MCHSLFAVLLKWKAIFSFTGRNKGSSWTPSDWQGAKTQDGPATKQTWTKRPRGQTSDRGWTLSQSRWDHILKPQYYMLPPGSNHLLYYVHLDDRAKDLRIHLTLMMTSAQVVETSVTTTDNSPSQSPGFKPFTVSHSLLNSEERELLKQDQKTETNYKILTFTNCSISRLIFFFLLTHKQSKFLSVHGFVSLTKKFDTPFRRLWLTWSVNGTKANTEWSKLLWL